MPKNKKTLTNGYVSAIRIETCNGEEFHWDITVSGIQACSRCGHIKEHANHKIDYAYKGDNRLIVVGGDGEQHPLTALQAYGYMSGELGTEEHPAAYWIADAMGVQGPSEIRAINSKGAIIE